MPAARPKARRAVLRLLPKGGVGAEVGVFRGHFARRILDVARPARLYLIDPWENLSDPGLAGARYAEGAGTDMPALHEEVLARFAPEVALGRVAVLRQRSAEALAGLPDGHLDFVYLDGDHRFEAVSQDLALAFAKLKPSGLLALDDHAPGGWWGEGVVRAVARFRAERGAALGLRLAQADQIVLEKQGS
jgi:hypothetical protein